MPAARIAILTSGPLCRNPRVLKEARTLGRAGYDVTVLTIANLERFEAFDREILREAPFRKIAVDLLARSPAARLRQTLSRGGTWLARHASRFGIESAKALGPYYSLYRLARGFFADLTITHTEIALCAGHRLIAEGRRVATDFEDWHTQDLLPDAQTTRPKRLLRRVEAELMRLSAYTSTTSHAMAAGLQEAYGGEKPVVLANSFPLDPPSAPHAPGDPPAFFWFSQTIGPGRGLELFLAAWRAMQRPSRLVLLGDSRPGYREKLLARLAPEKRSSLEFLPIVGPDLLPAVIARHDLGLALEAMIPANKNLTISNKILQYLNAGVGVIATGTAGQREVLARAPTAGLLVNLNETGELAAQLDELAAQPARIAAMGTAARRAAEELYCWETEEPRLLAAVAAALRNTSVAA